ncbi:MAG: cytochrome c3 family protein [Waddliaceae bacterium]
MRKSILIYVAIMIIGGVVAVLILTKVGSQIQQPVQFNHKIHVEMGLECIFCHQLYLTNKTAGRPQISTCKMCHEGAETENPELQKVVNAISEGKEIAWNRIAKLPTYVYFSHRTHVAFAELGCETCHGPMGETSKPPERPLKNYTMKNCMDCHEKSKVTNDCITCHK